ncbi:MAG: S-adenosyl-l-methionine hydroxide adenosyltransferase family protein [Balneolaceae bacterium]
MRPILTLTTDFGLKDHYVAAMKAVIIGISPNVRLVDISHHIPPQDIMAGAWVVRNATMYFPPKTVHLIVVDPGVGTNRNPVIIEIKDQLFVGPDNGIFSLIADNYEYKATKLSNPDYWLKNKSNTFHGRDVFAPVAAHLTKGVPVHEFGEQLDEIVTYRWAIPIADKDGIQGWVVHIDRFGNLITNIPESMLKNIIGNRSYKIYVGNMILNNILSTFGSVPDGEPVAYIGSSDVLEIGINKGNAKKMLGVEKGAQISIVLQK